MKKREGYSTFDEYGDVILYKPRGKESVTPIIHRAMYYVEEGQQCGPGDRQRLLQAISQKEIIQITIPHMTSREHKPASSSQTEWVIGVARFEPYQSWVRFNGFTRNVACFGNR